MPTSTVWTFIGRLAGPANEIAAHFVLSVMAILALAGTELLLRLLGIDNRMIPLTGVTLGDWMFDLDVVSATLINAVGMFRGAIVLWKAP
jgi:hypothetical protein